MSCTIPANQPIYQALLDKAASYPADKWRELELYRAAETVRKYNANIYEEFAKYGGFDGQPWYIGKSTEQFIRDFIKASPAPAPPTAAKCAVPANEPIYQALLDKAATYPAEKVYQARAYRAAAEKLRTHATDLFSIKDRTYELMDHLDQYWGPHVSEFIEKFIVAAKPSRPKCLWAPANEPIYKALLEKAAEATAAGLSWKAKAWTTSAEKMSAATIDLVAKYGTSEYDKVLNNFGPKAAELIDDYCCAAPSLQAAEDAEKRRTRMMSADGDNCFVPANNGIYNALLYRASKASNKYAAKHYTDAATKVLSSPRNLPLAWSAGQGEEAIRDLNVGPSIAAYIKHYLTETQGSKVFKYPTIDDELAVEALKIYCIKNNTSYSDGLLDEYKKWRPSASKWDLEEFDYEAHKHIPRPVAKIATTWATHYSAALTPQNVANKYKQGVINYCKRNNIVYQPVMLERLNAWREANKDKLVNTLPVCGCAPECAGGKMNTWPIGSTAVINRWFATLPKTVVL